MSFKEQWDKGTKFENHFNTLAKKAYPLVGKLRRIAIYELDSSGHAFFASNRPDVAEETFAKKYFLYQPNWQYIKKFKPKLQTFSTQFGHENSKIYQDKFKCTSVYIREQIDPDTQLIVLFNSTNPLILFDVLANNSSGVRKLLQFFKSESKDVLSYHKNHKFNISSVRPGYFVNSDDPYVSERDKTNYLLQTIGALDKNTFLTEREYQCLQLSCIGKSATQTGTLLGISNRAVESHFVNLKNKLKVTSKSKLMELLI